MTPTTFAAVNSVEGLLWIAVAAALIREGAGVRSTAVRRGLPAAFVLFALTDFAEVGLRGPLPGWLWWSKLLLGAGLFGLANYRDHVRTGPLSPAKLAWRAVAFVALLALFGWATTP